MIKILFTLYIIVAGVQTSYKVVDTNKVGPYHIVVLKNDEPIVSTTSEENAISFIEEDCDCIAK